MITNSTTRLTIIKEKYTLIPSVFRGKNWWREDYYYHEMIVRCADHFQNSTHLDKLVRMQHYGCPTRLMDITSNPLTALYFACNNFGCEKCDNSDSGEVIIFAVPTKEISYFDSDKALMLSCLAKFSASDKMKILSEIKNSDKEFAKDASASKYVINLLKSFIMKYLLRFHLLNARIVPNDLITPIFVQPEKTNERIVKQDGAFILSGLSKNEKEAIEKTEALCYTKLTICNQAEIKKELEALGINQATLFPEVDMVAEYLKYTVKNKK